jgi:glycyl-tRNA synthetase
MVKDLKSGQCHRADKLIEEHVEKLVAKKKDMKQDEKDRLLKISYDAGAYGKDQLNQAIKELNIKAPETGNDLSEALPFNLMFETQIGPTGTQRGFLRPETAQGIFINFRRLIDFNNGRMPFAAAQIGLGFRNEIHPKQGLLRVREFTMAEIEHFVDPDNKDHHKFSRVADLKLPLFSAQNQMTVERRIINDMTLAEAVANKVIDNQTLAYFMARTYLFLQSVGISSEGIRFRQHRSDEMAHYAKDCWDAEVETSYGWIEIAGHADRSCFDLSRHARRTKTELVAARLLPEPKQVKFVKVLPNKKEIGKVFKGDSKPINDVLEEASEEEKLNFMKEFEATGEATLTLPSGKQVKLNKDFVAFELGEKTQHEEKYTPSVIEPSFGIGRIVYCIFEHCFKIRPHEASRTYFTFPPLIAPLKCSILPLIPNPELNNFVQNISKSQVVCDLARVDAYPFGCVVQDRRLGPDHWQALCSHR